MGRLNSLSRKSFPILILSGDREIGKTTLLMGVISAFQRRGVIVKGLVSPAVFEGGEKTAIDLMDLSSGAKRRLAQLHNAETIGVMTQKWFFDPAALEWGNQILLGSIPCSLLVIDELGPLEFEKGQGFQNGIHILSEGGYLAAVAVVRPELVDTACQYWPGSSLVTLKDRHHFVKDSEEIIRQINLFLTTHP